MDTATLAGMVSTVLFAAANLPMVVKAVRSRDLRSYSASALIVGNLGNVVHTVYVASLPVGPIWVLHAFYLATMAIMLALYARWFARQQAERGSRDDASSPSADAGVAVRFGHGGRDRPARAGAGGISVR